jgi:hypothetical protein
MVFSGLMTYITLHGTIYLIRIISGGRLVPYDHDQQEPWSCTDVPFLWLIRYLADSRTVDFKTDLSLGRRIEKVKELFSVEVQAVNEDDVRSSH